MYANAYVVPNHYNHGFATFRDLVIEVRRDFPELMLSDDDIKCGTVVDSSWCKNCPVVVFHLKGWDAKTIRIPAGWTAVTHNPGIRVSCV